MAHFDAINIDSLFIWGTPYSVRKNVTSFYNNSFDEKGPYQSAIARVVGADQVEWKHDKLGPNSASLSKEAH